MSVQTLHHRTSPSNPRELSLVQQARGVEVEVVSVLEHCSAAAGHTLDTPSHSTIFRPLTSKFLSRILFRFTKMGRYHWQYHIKSAGSWTSAEGRWSLYNLGHGTSQNMVSRASSRKYTHILRYNGWSQDTTAEMWLTLNPWSQGLRVTSFELSILIVRSHTVPVEVVTEEIFVPYQQKAGM